MTPRNKHTDVEVIIVDDPWAEFGPPLPDQVPHRKAGNTSRVFKRWGVSSVAGLLTTVIHILVLSPLLLGSHGRKPRPPLTEGAPASQHNANASEFVSTLIFVSDQSITDPDTNDESVYDVISKEVDKALQHTATLAKLASVSQPEIMGSEKAKDDTAPTAEASGEDTGRALLFGMYMGQVKARIERAWDHPNAPLAGKFQCKVEIAQGEHGDVKEVTLQRCNGTAAWQMSLVQAIQRASPLPAPPSEKVFTAVLTLNFDALSTAQPP